MSATIQLRNGDMFAQPSDLIVIPCSTAATVTSAVERRLRHFAIAPPRGVMKLGDVKFSIFEGASSIATYVAYAASVQAMETSAAAISLIAERVALFVRDKPEIRDVTFPLLGSGAGGLSPEVAVDAILKGLDSIEVANKVFNIYVLEPSDFASLSKSFRTRSTESVAHSLNEVTPPFPDAIEKTREAIRVFISYTRTDANHQEWVRDLAVYLRQNGVDARLDVWHLRPGMDLPQWMSNEIGLADRILIVCDSEYASRADGRIGGVGWEMRLIQGDLLQSQRDNPKKYIPILRGNFDPSDVPRFLRGVYALSCRDTRGDEEYRLTLLKELYDAYEEAPPLRTQRPLLSSKIRRILQLIISLTERNRALNARASGR